MISIILFCSVVVTVGVDAVLSQLPGKTRSEFVGVSQTSLAESAS